MNQEPVNKKAPAIGCLSLMVLVCGYVAPSSR